MEKIFYKYFKFEWGLETLSTLRLRLSSPEGLNDPFEFNPKVSLEDITLEEATAFWKSDEGLEIIYYGKKVSQPFSEFKVQFLKNGIGDYVRNWMADRALAARNVDYCKALKSRFHIICGSKNPHSILMWSHYAENHGGLVLGFNQDMFPFPEFHQTGNILHVDYVDDRPVYKHRFIADTDYKLSEFRKVASKKYRDWEYEQEVRVVVPLGPKTLGRHIEQREESYYLVLYPENISTVITGAKMDGVEKNAIRQLLKDNAFSHILPQEAVLEDGAFAIQTRPL